MTKLKRHYAKIRIDNIIWYLVLTPLLKTNGVMEHYQVLSTINNTLAFCSVAILVYAFIKLNKYRNMHNLFFQACLFGYILLRTVRLHNDINYGTFIIAILYCLGLSLFVQVLADKPCVLIKAFLINLELYICVNFVSLLLFPNGIYLTGSGRGACWFLGYDNWWFIIFYVATMFSVMHYEMTGNVFRLLFLNVIIHLSAFITMSGVLLFGVLFLDLLLLTKIYKSKLMSFKAVCIATIAVNIILIAFSTTGIVAYVVTLLQRPISTLLVRNRMWNITLQEIAKNWQFGYGRLSPQYRIKLYNLAAGVNAHNMWLEILYEGGLIGALLFIAIIITAGKGIKMADSNNAKQVLLACLLTCFIGLSVDSVLFELRGNLLFVIFAIGANMKQIGNNSYYVVSQKPRKIKFKIG